MTPTFLQDFGSGKVPIFAPLDPYTNKSFVQIGYWTKDSDLCRAVVQIYSQYMGAAGQAVYPPSEWTTRNDWGLDTPVSAYCAAKGLRPSWSAATADGGYTVAAGAGPRQEPISYSPQADGSFNATDAPAEFRTNNPATDAGPAFNQVVSDIERGAGGLVQGLAPTWLQGPNGVVVLGASALALWLFLRRRAA